MPLSCLDLCLLLAGNLLETAAWAGLVDLMFLICQSPCYCFEAGSEAGVEAGVGVGAGFQIRTLTNLQLKEEVGSVLKKIQSPSNLPFQKWVEAEAGRSVE